MKEKIYTSVNQIMFCPNCHRRVNLPFRGNMNIKGKLKIKCSLCKNGIVIVEGK